jgi:hypothetical protein
MSTFLQTKSGLLNANAIVRIGPVRVWDKKANDHEIDYRHGQEARTTSATAVDVQTFLEAQP